MNIWGLVEQLQFIGIQRSEFGKDVFAGFAESNHDRVNFKRVLKDGFKDVKGEKQKGFEYSTLK